MERIVLNALVLATAAYLSAPALAQQKVDFGKREYETSCAICHGLDAKGGGLYTAHLKVTPPDLTTLAKRNNGVFPVTQVYETIDGRKQIAAHGPRDMPIWGARYSESAVGYFADVPYDAESYIRNRILVLIDYLYRIQQK